MNSFQVTMTGEPVAPKLFPVLHRDAWPRVFVQYNTSLPSFAAVERLYSIGGDVLRSKRACLTTANFESLVFLKGNLGLLSLSKGSAWD